MENLVNKYMEAITPRKVLQDLGYAPALSVPPVVAQPTPAVQKLGQVDVAQVNQFVQALSGFNSSLLGFAKTMYNDKLETQTKQLPIDIGQWTKTYEENKDTINQSLGSYIESQSKTYGYLPKVRQEVLHHWGRKQAYQQFAEAFAGSESRITSLDKSENPDDIGKEVYQKIRQGFGDNMYILAGVDEAYNENLANFKVRAAANKDRQFEHETENRASEQIQATIEQFRTAPTPEGKVAAINSLFEIQSGLRNIGVKDFQKMFKGSLQQGILALAYSDPDKADDLLDLVENYTITDPKTKQVVGQFAKSNTENATMITSLREAVNIAHDRKQARSQKQNEEQQKATQIKAENIVAKAFDYARLNNIALGTAKFLELVDEAVKDLVPNEAGLDAVERGKLRMAINAEMDRAQRNDAVGTVAIQENILKGLEAAENQDSEAVAAIRETLPLYMRLDYDKQVIARMDASKLLLSQSTGVAGDLSKLARDIKTIYADEQDNVVGRQEEALNEYRQLLIDEYKINRPKFSGSNSEYLESQEFSTLRREVYNTIKDKFRNEKALETAKQDAEKPFKSKVSFDDVIAKTIFLPSGENLKEQIRYADQISEKTLSLRTAAGLDPATKLTDKHQAYYHTLNNTYIPKLRAAEAEFGQLLASGTLPDGTPLTPEGKQKITIAWQKAKDVVGYTPEEILKKRTAEGVEIKVEDLANTAAYVKTPMFKNLDALIDANVEFLTAKNKKTSQLYLMGKALGLDFENKEDITQFLEAQQRILKWMPSTNKPDVKLPERKAFTPMLLLPSL